MYRTTTLFIVLATTVFNGGMTARVLKWAELRAIDTAPPGSNIGGLDGSVHDNVENPLTVGESNGEASLYSLLYEQHAAAEQQRATSPARP